MLAQAPTAASLGDAVWIDLLSGTEAERAEVHAATGLRLPTKDEIEEIETTSRVYLEDGALYVSTPVLAGNDCAKDTLTALGCVITPKRFVTIRFADFPAIKELNQGVARLKEPSAGEACLRLLEIIVDHTADALERAGAELEAVSHAAFRSEAHQRRQARLSAELRASLRKLGRMSDGVSHLRDSLLGLGRIAAFVHENAHAVELELPPARLNAVRADIASLNDYQAHLAAKVQFLLDATLGFISIQQNEIVKTLTVVSVVGVPPVLIAGIYGMNFHVMPELNWAFGYPFALGLIVLSGIIPLALMKWRGWM
jgi:magnesium transporter